MVFPDLNSSGRLRDAGQGVLLLCHHSVHLPQTQHLQGGHLHRTLQPWLLLELVGREMEVLECGFKCILCPMSSDTGDKVVDCNVIQMNPPGGPACALPCDTTT